MNEKTLVIVWLSIQLTLLSLQLCKDERRIGYLEGQQLGQTVTIEQPEEDGTYPGYKWQENVPTDKKKKLHKN